MLKEGIYNKYIRSTFLAFIPERSINLRRMAMPNSISVTSDTDTYFRRQRLPPEKVGAPKPQFRVLRIHQINPQIDWYNAGGDIANGKTMVEEGVTSLTLLLGYFENPG